jgi:hypothetical protein
VSWADIYGQFLFSQPRSDVNYQQFDTGNLALLSQALLYSGQQYLLSAEANLPHTSGSLGVEVRPFRRVRVIESWLTDRLHNAASSRASQVLTPAPAVTPQLPLQNSRLVSNYNQEQIDLFLDLSRKLTLRGGYRYVWGEASTLVLPVTGLLVPDSAQLRRTVGIGGFVFRPNQKLLVSGDVEAATGDQYDYLARQSSVSFLWAPKGGKRFTLQGDYTRATVRSDISYLVPQALQAARSFYRDNAHLGSAILDIALPGYRKLAPKLSLGGSLLISSGSRPTSYYQPLGKLVVPISARVAWVSDWRYYGFGETFYAYEGFRTHLITTGLRLTR